LKIITAEKIGGDFFAYILVLLLSFVRTGAPDGPKGRILYPPVYPNLTK
jgi:hypothetical protein